MYREGGAGAVGRVGEKLHSSRRLEKAGGPWQVQTGIWITDSIGVRAFPDVEWVGGEAEPGQWVYWVRCTPFPPLPFSGQPSNLWIPRIS